MNTPVPSGLWGNILVAAAVSVFSSCSQPTPRTQEVSGMSRHLGPGVSAEPLAAPTRPDGSATSPLFTQVKGGESGVAFGQSIEKDHPSAHLFLSAMASGGLAIGDLTGDGRPDLFFVHHTGSNRLYQQTAPWRFEEVIAQADPTEKLAGHQVWGMGVSLADVDNDKDLDVYLCNYDAPNQLFINDGKGHFREQAAEYGVNLHSASHSSYFADYDRDGDLDLFVLTNRFVDPFSYKRKMELTLENGTPIVSPEMARFYEPFFDPDEKSWYLRPMGQTDRLYRNDGGRYVDISETLGMDKLRGDGLSAVWWDANHDGWLDLFVANDFDAVDLLWINDGRGSFKENLAGMAPHTSWASMGCDVGDLNRDGHPDLLVADMSATNHFKQKVNMGGMGGLTLRRAVKSTPPQYMRNSLLLGTGTDRMLEAGFAANLESSDWTWTVKIADLDADGWDDVFFTNGMSRDTNDSDFKVDEKRLTEEPEWSIYKDRPLRSEQNLALKNPALGKGQIGPFIDRSAEWGLGLMGVSYGAAHGDLDGDGDLDLVVMNLDQPVSLYRNDTQAQRLSVRLSGKRFNHQGIGAQVSVTISGQTQEKMIMPQSGYLSSNAAELSFGLGDVTVADLVVVKWPDGTRQTVSELPAGHRYSFSEPEATAAPEASADALSSSQKSEPWLRPLAMRLPDHQEKSADDYQKQSLLPQTYSQDGPVLLMGDLNADGHDDAWLSGCAGLPGEVRLYDPKLNAYRSVWQDALQSDKMSEDTGGALFDADNDGDLDLFVVSGSYEVSTNDPRHQDRLYFNDGQANFTKAAPDVLPVETHAGGAVAAADFDGDGSVDIFISGRVVPGRYPLAPTSLLWKNQGGRFADVTPEAFKSLGLVTAAQWADMDGDSRLDLVIAQEWGPLRLFAQRQAGQLVEIAPLQGLSEHSGWWSAVAVMDATGDGKLDIVAGNHGLNSKYHASPERPAQLFFGDFFGQGEPQLVEAEFEGDKLFPIRGRSCSSRAMPKIAEKFATYRDFASAELPQIYTATALEKAEKRAVTQLQSGLFVNKSNGSGLAFEFVPFPSLAQLSPIKAVALLDIDGDQSLDVVAGQNYHGAQIETGHYDGGLGVVLKSESNGHFKAISPDQSGFCLPGATTSLSLHRGRVGTWQVMAGRNSLPFKAWEPAALGKEALGKAIRPVSKGCLVPGVTVVVTYPNGTTATQVSAAALGLGQSTALWFASNITKITAIWPDGRRTTAADLGSQKIIELTRDFTSQ